MQPVDDRLANLLSTHHTARDISGDVSMTASTATMATATNPTMTTPPAAYTDESRPAVRRAMLRHALTLALSACAPALTMAAPARVNGLPDLARSLATLERKSGGRLGVHVIDAATGARAGHRSDERFGMCSTFKLLLVAALLNESDAGRINLQEIIPFTQADMVPHAPVTSKQLPAGRMTLQALAQATQVTSDNPAANLIIKRLGGPEAVTQLWFALGDDVTRLDRYEPDLNLVTPGSALDSTTPSEMATSVLRLFTSEQLKPASRDLLFGWMEETRTGMKRLRAGLPPTWKAGDKTGTAVGPGMVNKHNDVALFWPQAGKPPVVIAAYYDAPGSFSTMRPQDDAVLRQVGEQVAAWVKDVRKR